MSIEAAGRTGPILLYDNDCSLCTRFARFTQRTSKGWVKPIGLFSQEGSGIKCGFFRPEDRPDEMFWILLDDVGYGGRSGLLPLLREIIRGRLIIS
ncbi:MAG TPA: hypothetical protein VE177_06305 [Candidatus Binatus sp.]|nr:hypothetical protein [Candidatus Binatus sp.]